jgi:glycosyltransferase involved in cell wall biosynthesis
MIVSTEWLKRRYRKFNPNIFLCRNSVDTRLYDFELPERDTINIGWAGGEGHAESVKAWLPAVNKILDEFENARFITIGLPLADFLKRPERCFSIPMTMLENFPAALTNFDIAIAPAGRSNFFAAKSDLRFLETGALGIPIVADPFVYSVLDGDTGMEAETADDAYVALKLLMLQPEKARSMGANARRYVREWRDIKQGIEQWEEVFPVVWDQ